MGVVDGQKSIHFDNLLVIFDQLMRCLPNGYLCLFGCT